MRIIISIVIPVLLFFAISQASGYAAESDLHDISNLLYPASDFIRFWPLRVVSMFTTGGVSQEEMYRVYALYSLIFSLVVQMIIVFVVSGRWVGSENS